MGAELLDLVTCPLGDDQLAPHAALAAQRPREPVVLPLRLRSRARTTRSARWPPAWPPAARRARRW